MNRKITTTYQIVYPSEPDVYPEIENGWEDEEGESMEPDAYDIEDGRTAADKAIKFLSSKYVSETSGSPWRVGDSYLMQGDMDYRTGKTESYTYHLEGFSFEEEEAIFCGVFPRRAEREQRRAEWEEIRRQERQRAVRERMVIPHGLCEGSKFCVEHRQNKKIPSCKRSKGRRTS